MRLNREGLLVPVRKIPKNHLVVTGGYSSRKNTEIDAFESTLEKDYFILLDFDETVHSPAATQSAPLMATQTAPPGQW